MLIYHCSCGFGYMYQEYICCYPQIRYKDKKNVEDSDEEIVEEVGNEDISHCQCCKQRMEMKADKEVLHHRKRTMQQDEDLQEVSLVSKLPKVSHRKEDKGPCSSTSTSKWGVATSYE